MEKIVNQFHNRDTFLYVTARLFERAAYYGLRALIVLYLVGDNIKMEDVDATSFYEWLTASLIVSGILGAVLGDLIIGNRNAFVLGGVLQTIGAFVLSISSLTTLYIGLGLVVIGSGLFSPNFLSNFGKLYLGKKQLLDSAFSILYLGINIGVFIGVVSIGYVGEVYSFKLGFLLSGCFLILSLVISFFCKEDQSKISFKNQPFKIPNKVNILLVFIVLGIFWSIYDLGEIHIKNISKAIAEGEFINVPKSMFIGFNSIFYLPTSIILIIFWSYYYNKDFNKLALGFIVGAIGYTLLLFIPGIPIPQHLVFYFISMLLLAISEIFVAPIALAALARYTNPKYLAIVFSLIFIPIRLLSYGIAFFEDIQYLNFDLRFCAIVMLFVSVGLMMFLFIKKNAKVKVFPTLD